MTEPNVQGEKRLEEPPLSANNSNTGKEVKDREIDHITNVSSSKSADEKNDDASAKSVADTTTTTSSEPPKQQKEPDVVLDKLLDPTEFKETVSSLWGWVAGSANLAAQKVSSASSTVQTLASKVESMASTVVTIASRENEMNNNNNEGKGGETDGSKKPHLPAATILPWDMVPSENKAEARARVMKLSMDDKTFLVPPPPITGFVYDVEASAGVAERLTQIDPLLSSKRFKLVPKRIDERNFWLNYFYRIHLVVDALGASSPSLAAEAVVSEEGEEERGNAVGGTNSSPSSFTPSAAGIPIPTGGGSTTATTSSSPAAGTASQHNTKRAWEEEMRAEMETVRKNDESFEMMDGEDAYSVESGEMDEAELEEIRRIKEEEE